MRNLAKGVAHACGLTVALFGITCRAGLASEWKAINAGLASIDVRSLAVDPLHPTALYAGTGNGVFKSTDGGATWRQSGLAALSVAHLLVDFVKPDILYAAIDADGFCLGQPLLFKSSDGGASWNGLFPPLDGCETINALVMDPVNPNTLYLAQHFFFGVYYFDLYRSDDGGATWGSPRADCPIDALAIDPVAPSTLYAGTLLNQPFVCSPGLLRSTNGGLTWSKASLANTVVNVLAIDPKTPNVLYAATRSDYYSGSVKFRGLLKSVDSAASWSAINNGLDLLDTQSTIEVLLIDPDNPTTLYAGTAGSGVFKSSDGGASWGRLNDGLRNYNARSLALIPGSGGPNVLYAGTAGGVFKLVDDGLPTDPSPATRTFFVPIVLSSEGIHDSFYTSEMTLANRSARSVTVQFAYASAFGGGTGTVTDTLEAGRQRIVPSVMSYLRRLGMPIPESGNRGGTLQVRFDGLSTPDEVAVIVRTTTTVPEGRAGVAYPGVPPDSLLDGEALLLGLRQDAVHHTNVAFQNAGNEGDVTLRLRVFSNGRFSSPLPDLVIPPGGFQQINEILHSYGLTASSGYVSVERVSGSAPFYAYAILHNKESSDSAYIPPVFTGSSVRRSSRLIVPAVPSGDGKLKSELVLTNGSRFVSQRLLISFQVVWHDPVSVVAEIGLRRMEQFTIPDAVTWLGELASNAHLSSPPHQIAGPLVITVEGQDTGEVFAGIRVSASNGGREYGFFFPAIPAERESRSPTWLFGLQQNSETRSNLAIVNLGTEPNRFSVELFDGKTGMQAGRVENITVNPQGSFQLNSLLADYTIGVNQGYARVVPSNTEPFVTYAVIVDGARPGERTGDGSVVNSWP